MPMAPDQIKIDRCYLLRAENGREIVAKVAKIFENRLTLLSEDRVQLAAIPIRTAQFLWRQTVEGSPWSGSHQLLSVANFAECAEKEVACD
jgi:hypothetical protein